MPIWTLPNKNYKSYDKINQLHHQAAKKVTGNHKHSSNLGNLIELGWCELKDMNIKQCLNFLHTVNNFKSHHRIKKQMYEIMNDDEKLKNSVFWKTTFEYINDLCKHMNITKQQFYKFSKNEYKKHIKKYLAAKYQQRWNNYNKSKFFKSCKPVLGKNDIWNLGGREGCSMISQLRSGFDFLNHTTCKYNPLKDNLCEVCGEVEDVEHYLIKCRKYVNERIKLQNTLKDIHIDLNDIEIGKLLGMQNFEKHNQKIIQLSLIEYILETNRHLEESW